MNFIREFLLYRSIKYQSIYLYLSIHLSLMESNYLWNSGSQRNLTDLWNKPISQTISKHVRVYIGTKKKMACSFLLDFLFFLISINCLFIMQSLKEPKLQAVGCFEGAHQSSQLHIFSAEWKRLNHVEINVITCVHVRAYLLFIIVFHAKAQYSLETFGWWLHNDLEP